MIGSCPECKEAIRIPEGPPTQMVRCPLCTAEYELENVFNQLPPMLELIGGTGEALGIQIEAAADLELSNAEDKSSSTSGSPATRYQPQKRKQTSAFAEILKVVLGGALALPIGVLCVWWFAGRAPFGISEKVGEYVPWIVPEKLRGGDNVGPSDLEPDLKNSNNKTSPNPNDSNSKKQKANRKLNEPNGGSGTLGLTKSIENNSQSNAKNDKTKSGENLPSKNNDAKSNPPDANKQNANTPADKQETKQSDPTTPKSKSAADTKTKNADDDKQADVAGKSKTDNSISNPANNLSIEKKSSGDKPSKDESPEKNQNDVNK